MTFSSDQFLFDSEHLWHPYTSATNPLPVYAVRSAHGCKIVLESGRELIDGMASWWCVIHGYNRPELNEAVKKQLEKMAHVMFGGLTHEPAVSLGQKLVALTPEPMQHVFFADSGSVSVEVAIKMAVQYWQAKGLAQKTKLLSLRSGYHGDTLGAMSVCDPVTGMHSLFTGILPQQFFTEAPRCGFHTPWDERFLEDFERKISAHAAELAAVILEPIVQGAGGMRFYSPKFLCRVRALCDVHNVLLICDEIATGFGRTGKLFACEWAGISPDIMCVGKALTGGYMTLAATLATKDVAYTISDNGGVMMHGPTFMANPLACAAANASIAILEQGHWQKQVKTIETLLADGLSPCKDMQNVAEVRVLGAIGVVEMRQPVDVAVCQKHFVEKGVWVRPFGKCVYVMPPYIISINELEQLTSAIVDVVREL